MKVSIIMPVYNARLTLERALRSIKNQTYNDYELLLIDDGSNDDSLVICHNYAKNDNRIKVFHQKNKGPAAARNIGLKNICGDLLMCVDADDVLHEDAIEKLVKKMEQSNADMCIFGWNKIENGTIIPYVFQKNEMEYDIEKLYKKILRGNYKCGGGNPWNKIWKIEAFKNCGGIHLFDETIKIYEDMLWTLRNLECIKNVVFENEQLYDYYVLDNSLSRNENLFERKEQFYIGAKKVLEYVRENHKSAFLEANQWFRTRLCSFLHVKYKFGIILNEEEKKELKSFSIFPTKRDRFGDWIRFIYVKIYENKQFNFQVPS